VNNAKTAVVLCEDVPVILGQIIYDTGNGLWCQQKGGEDIFFGDFSVFFTAGDLLNAKSDVSFAQWTDLSAPTAWFAVLWFYPGGCIAKILCSVII